MLAQSQPGGRHRIHTLIAFIFVLMSFTGIHAAEPDENWFHVDLDGISEFFTNEADGQEWMRTNTAVRWHQRSPNCFTGVRSEFINRTDRPGTWQDNYWWDLDLFVSPTCFSGVGPYRRWGGSELICKENWYFDNDIHFCRLAPPCPEGDELDPANPPNCRKKINEKKNAGKPKVCLTPPQSPPLTPLRGNPIHVGTGNKFQQETDYQSSVPNGLAFRRYYNTQGYSVGRIGRGWFADYWQRLIIVSVDEHVEVRRPDGSALQFHFQNNQWQSDADVVETLEQIKDTQGVTTHWRLTLANDSVEEYEDFTNFAILTAIIDRSGLTTTIVNDLPVQDGGDTSTTSPDIVTDPFGRTLQFTYDAVTANLSTLVDPAGNVTRYTQVGDRQLQFVAYPDETPLDPNDNPTRVYHYEDSRFANYLTGITDETGQRFATFGYDGLGRANLTEYAGGAERVTVTYNKDRSSVVTDALGSSQTYDFVLEHGMLKVSDISGDPCNTCSGQIKSVTYDVNGFVASQTDFNGNVTTFIHDSRGLETSRTEAVGTPEERTITTTWHPTFRLPLTITEQGQVTTFTYDTQGRLLTRQITED